MQRGHFYNCSPADFSTYCNEFLNMFCMMNLRMCSVGFSFLIESLLLLMHKVNVTLIANFSRNQKFKAIHP